MNFQNHQMKMEKYEDEFPKTTHFLQIFVKHEWEIVNKLSINSYFLRFSSIIVLAENR
jgi:hypothetical protein